MDLGHAAPRAASGARPGLGDAVKRFRSSEDRLVPLHSSRDSGVMLTAMDRLRLRLAGGVTHPSFVRLLLAAGIAALGVGSGPAIAGGSGPERPPISVPTKIAPEPAPVAVTPVAATTSPQPPSPQPSATPARPAAVA